MFHQRSFAHAVVDSFHTASYITGPKGLSMALSAVVVRPFFPL